MKKNGFNNAKSRRNKTMSEENQNTEAPKPNTNLPKFDLPKAAAPTVRFGSDSAPEAKAPAFSNPRPADFGASAASGSAESPALVLIDAVCAAVAIAFAVLFFLDK